MAVYDCKGDGSLDNATYFEAGVQPDMVTFADNDTILTADEGEPQTAMEQEQRIQREVSL